MSHQSSSVEFLSIRGLRYAIRHWGDPQAPMVFFLHGWMDSSPTFQFVVDALQSRWHVVAPDWRGYGQSEWLSRPYWFPDYYADLALILDHYSSAPVRLVGHSMGANIAGIFAGLRPQRVAQLCMIDFLGLPVPTDTDACTQLSQWLTESGKTHAMRAYPNHAALARRLTVSNPRLTEARAAFLAQTVSFTQPDGQVAMACDPWHKIPSPQRYHLEDTLSSWRRISAPVQLVVAEHGYVNKRFAHDPAQLELRMGAFARHESITIGDAGHNIQHDQPEALARAIEAFLLRHGSAG
ncbi:alpha/beta hydrolase [Rhodoferax sp.]|uniref:alpha/beta fold hydrolase n=1 Tax=Rhodoferax sp. TaxID=50421 RepID=UPI0025F32F28|nr:alpha/beta hydrolase [Rhodoferax sp.]MCM2295764.1 alpha/beta hydrolase [Rhodoferax sp.]